MVLEHTIAYSDLAQTWLALDESLGALPKRQHPAGDQIQGFPKSFAGDTRQEMRDRVSNGYLVDGMKVKPSANTRPRRKLRFDEEGEIQVDMALSGHDTPFLTWGKRERTPGLKLDVELAVRSSTPATVLTDYAEWLASLVAGLQAKGYDLEINVVSRAKGTVYNAPNSRIDVAVRVKRFGRKSDLKSWGAILSPGGFRRLIFLARVMACEAHGKVCSEGFGGSFGPTWGLEMDPKTRTLTVKCAAITQRFPREEMDAQLAALKI